MHTLKTIDKKPHQQKGSSMNLPTTTLRNIICALILVSFATPTFGCNWFLSCCCGVVPEETETRAPRSSDTPQKIVQQQSMGVPVSTTRRSPQPASYSSADLTGYDALADLEGFPRPPYDPYGKKWNV